MDPGGQAWLFAKLAKLSDYSTLDCLRYLVSKGLDNLPERASCVGDDNIQAIGLTSGEVHGCVQIDRRRRIALHDGIVGGSTCQRGDSANGCGVFVHDHLKFSDAHRAELVDPYGHKTGLQL